MKFDEEVFAVILAIVTVASVFAVAQTIPRKIEPFTAIGLLGPKGKIGDYPKHVYIGERIKLYIFLDNHLGKPAFLQVRMKLGSKGRIPTNSTPLNVTPVFVFERILNDGGNYTREVTFTLNKTGTNIALVFELWRYDTTLKEWVYDKRWVHLYVNVSEVILP